jgi:hypothetical protein
VRRLGKNGDTLRLGGGGHCKFVFLLVDVGYGREEVEKLIRR